MMMIEALIALIALTSAVVGGSRVIAMNHMRGSRVIPAADSGGFGGMYGSREDRDHKGKKESNPLHCVSRYHGWLATAICRSPQPACDELPPGQASAGRG